MRNMLAYGIHKDAGERSPYHFVVPARMQSNSLFYGTAHIVENGGDRYLSRIGRDPNGALYKMYDTLASVVPNEKKTRRFEDKADLQELISKAGNLVWQYDNVDLSETINYLAAMIVTGNVDCCHKNYYCYRDTEGDGEWEMLPWDVDLSFGRNWDSTQSYWDDRVYPNNGLFVGGNNTLPSSLFAGGSATRQMYLRRVRTLMDEMQQPNGTPAADLIFEKQIDAWAAVLTPDALMDLQKWFSWGGGNDNIRDTNSPFWRDIKGAVSQMKTNYLPARRDWVFNQKMGNTAEFPNPQSSTVSIQIGAIDYNPSSGNQQEEYIQLINTNNFAVDISGWKLSGAVTHTFQGGVVLSSTNSVYVAANKRAFRSRTTGPRGGQRLYVEGPYSGQLSARGETLLLSDKGGRVVSTNFYQGNPSGPQQSLRITEIMYHPPAPPAGTLLEAEDYEYIELRNTGPTPINLGGVHFANGVEFTFPASTLAPGAYVLVVRNQAAFTSRYGSGLNVAGEYVGILDNGGENLRLDDAVGEQILNFTYNNSWYPITDGPGASLVILNETGDRHTWDLKQSWRPSAADFGSPGLADPAPTPVLPVLVNEVLTHTDLPTVDAIELVNPNPVPVNIGGWFLSDDFAQPKKYVFPAGTTLAAGAYLALYETNSFGVGPKAFALSSQGDETYLFSGNGTNISGFFDGFSYGAAENGVSFGRYVNSQTNTHFVAQAANSLGAANGLPKVGPVVLSEINYRPIEPLVGVDNTFDEYVELANITASPVPLFDPAHPTNTWRLRGGIDFNFPPSVTLPANGHVLVVSFNPAEPAPLAIFRAHYSVAPSVIVVGPFSGQLANTGASLRVLRPDAPDTNGAPYILVDQVDYSNANPWPPAADGFGGSLQRSLESAYGNDATNWTAVGPSAGLKFVSGGTPPSILTQPANTNGVLGRSVQFSVTGKCKGARVIGTGIYYAARSDAVGEDTFTISARLATGEVSTRSFAMFISDGL